MSAVRLNRPLVLETRQQVPDGLGGFAESWVVLGRLWAEIVPGTGRDLAGEEIVLSAVPLRITVRAAPVAAPSRPVAGQRFRDGTRAYRIVAVTERDPDGRYLTCVAREEVVT
jgi:head-tail adaptor